MEDYLNVLCWIIFRSCVLL